MRTRVQAVEGGPFIGGSRAIVRVVEQVRHLASTQAAVLIAGEPGTGKRDAACALHACGPRRAAAFVTVDCAAVAPETLERDLFGSDRPGDDLQPGALERAEGGTVYLESVGDASQAVQARLLRLLQEHAFERIGGQATRRADVRVIAGTATDLEGLARAGRFRDDLGQRLAAARITMPPLRERAEDIPPMVARFLHEAGRRHRRGMPRVTRGALERLQRHAWPGNVRELRNTIERMVIAAPGGRPLGLSDLPEPLRGDGTEGGPATLAPGMTVDETVRALIVATLEHVGHDKPRAAAMLGIGLRTLYRRIKEYGIQ